MQYLRLLALATASLLAACSSGSGSSPAAGSSIVSTNATNTTGSAGTGQTEIDAGYKRVVLPGATVTLQGATSIAGDMLWQQTAGTSVDLRNATSEAASFSAPAVTTTETLWFSFSVTDDSTSVSDQVAVEIHVAAAATNATVSADFSDREGWQCIQDPVATPDVTIETVGGYRHFDSNGIPAHSTGSFPNSGNPNSISAVYSSRYVTLEPEHTGFATSMAEFGVTLDGVKLERDTAESYRNEGLWRYEAITAGLAAGASGSAAFTWLGTDCNNAHVQPTGTYHYHGLPEGLIDRLGESDVGADTMILGGYAADGFPFYLRYGYANPEDPASDLVPVAGSWELRSGTRGSEPGGAYDGTFREDWEYVVGSGDLDECNGRFGVTPEYPNGTYHYYLTDDYPYIPRCVFGTPDASFRRGR
ncbi:MAG: YHYH protein [Pseudomonadota bacterium]